MPGVLDTGMRSPRALGGCVVSPPEKEAAPPRVPLHVLNREAPGKLASPVYVIVGGLHLLGRTGSGPADPGRIRLGLKRLAEEQGGLLVDSLVRV